MVSCRLAGSGVRGRVSINTWLGYRADGYFLGAVAASASGASASPLESSGWLGAGLSGYIGTTFMRAQADASAHLRQFFAQPAHPSRHGCIADVPSTEHSLARGQAPCTPNGIRTGAAALKARLSAFFSVWRYPSKVAEYGHD